MPQNALDEYKFLILPSQSLKTGSAMNMIYTDRVKPAQHLPVKIKID